MKKAAFIIGIISTVIMALLTTFISLAWMIPMLFMLNKNINEETQPSVLFKVLYLLFVSRIGGIILLCDKEESSNNPLKTSGTLTQKLEELENLKYQGIITEEEYQEKRKQILGI